MIIAVYGDSKTGKTTVSAILSDQLSLPVRHCGEEVKRCADRLGKRLEDLTEEEHAIVDSETRKWATSGGRRIVEGRFLRHVLGSLRNVWFIELRCNNAERELRYKGRVQDSNGNTLAQEDRVTESLETALYPHSQTAVCQHKAICTDNKSKNDVVEEIRKYVSASFKDSTQ